MAYGNALQRWIYKNSPVSLQTIIVSIYGLKERKKRYGAYFNKYLQYLKEAQWYSEERLSKIQNHKLKELIEYSYEYVPYYRELFDKHKIKPQDIRSSKDLVRIPILEKETVKNNLNKFISKQYSVKDALVSHTSGTSGTPLTVYATKDFFEREYAFRWSHFSWGNIKQGERFATFGGHPVVPIDYNKPPFWRYNSAEKQLIFSSQHISQKTLKLYIKALNTFKPAMIHSYPSAIYLIARYLVENKLSCVIPKAIYTCSETLLKYQRNIIEKAFKCKVFKWYGSTECVAHVTECEKGKMHIQPLHSVMEVINRDGEAAEEGEEGVIIGTNLDNWIMPLIRYNIGDTCIPTKKKCDCGREYPLVTDILGRIEDYIITPEGRYVGRLDHIFKADIRVKEAQLIQEEKELIRIKIVRDNGFSKQDQNCITEGLSQRLGHSMRYNFEFVDHIPRVQNNKFKFVINKCNKKCE
jgi:phenylacetate-CoA ligase